MPEQSTVNHLVLCAGSWAGFNPGPSLQPPMGDLLFNGAGLGGFGGPPTPPGPHPFGPLDAGLGSFNGSLGASALPGMAQKPLLCTA